MEQVNNPSESRRPIRILHLEDNPRDVELIRGLLEADGFNCEVLQADIRERFEAVPHMQRVGLTKDVVVFGYFMIRVA